MDQRRLGSTDLYLSSIGFGAFKIGRNTGTKYPASYELPDDTEVERLLNEVLDIGVTYIDTAPAYGCSEERIGRFLHHRRDQFVLSTKAGETFDDGQSHYDFSQNGIIRSVHRSLKRLRRETLDLVFIHSSGDDLHILNETGAVDAMNKLCEDGLIRYAGFSGKTVQGAKLAMTWADALMVEYHLNDQSHREVIREASQAGLGVIVKKGLASGHLNAPDAIGFLLSDHHISSIVIGGLNPVHFRENVLIASERREN